MSTTAANIISELDLNSYFSELTEAQKLAVLNSALQQVGELYNDAGKDTYLTNTLDGASVPSSVLFGTKYVSPSFTTGANRYANLADAVEDAIEGDTIIVFPGTYIGGFTVAVANLSIVGTAPAACEAAAFVGGVIVSGACSGGGKYGLRMENIAIKKTDAAGDVYKCGPQSTSRIDHVYINCKFMGTAYNNGYHAFLAEAGSGVTISNCAVYKSSHGFALRCSNVNANGLYVEDCGDQSGIIVKSDTGSGDASGVNIANFVIRSTVSQYCRGIAITSENAGYKTQGINISNGMIIDCAGNAINIFQSAGILEHVSFTNVLVKTCAGVAFLAQSGKNIAFTNCHAISALTYSFRNVSATLVSVINCGSTTPGTGDILGSFTAKILNAAITFSQPTNFDSTIDVSGILYLRSALQILNKAGNAFIAVAARNTSGAEVVYDLSNIGTLDVGQVTTRSTTLMGSSVALANGSGGNAGTLTNAPAAGNPTKWIPINDNGTLRYIPAW